MSLVESNRKQPKLLWKAVNGLFGEGQTNELSVVEHSPADFALFSKTKLIRFVK